MAEAGSQFSIKFYQVEGLVSPELTARSAAAARRIVLDALGSGAARRAEIRDPAGNLILEYPSPSVPD